MPPAKHLSEAINWIASKMQIAKAAKRFLAVACHDSSDTLMVTTHPVWAGRGLAAWAAGIARASRMALRAPRPFRRPVSTIEQRAA
jgi:hypothetical protein